MRNHCNHIINADQIIYGFTMLGQLYILTEFLVR